MDERTKKSHRDSNKKIDEAMEKDFEDALESVYNGYTERLKKRHFLKGAPVVYTKKDIPGMIITEYPDGHKTYAPIK